MRQCFKLVGRIGWPESEVQKLADMYFNTLNSAPMGLSMHIIEVFCEELAKVIDLSLLNLYFTNYTYLNFPNNGLKLKQNFLL